MLVSQVTKAGCILIAGLSLCGAFPLAGNAAEYVGTPETYLSAVSRLGPGDRLVLTAGAYRQGLQVSGLRGTGSQPIVIEGPGRGPPAVLVGRRGHNTVSLRHSSHVVIRNLVLDGADLEVDAVKAEHGGGLVHHITLEALTIVRHGIDQGVIGISTKTPAAFWTIRNNIIIGAGTGMYLGNSDGTAPFVAGVIEGNLIVNTVGYSLQIKHQRARPVLDGLPVSPQRTVIRGNFLSKAKNASTGELARPNLLLGHFPVEGPGSSDEYLVTENVLFANPVESLMQAEGNVVIARNVFINHLGDGIAVQPHNDVPRQIEIRENFLVASGYGIRVQGAHPGYAQVVKTNRDFSEGVIMADKDLERAFREWLSTEFARRPNDRRASRAIERALRMACSGRDDADLAKRSGLIPRAHFVCQQL